MMECRVLVVDDQEPLRYTFEEVFGRMGYSVQAVGSAAEALQKIPIFCPHICAIDYSMPQMNGLELLKIVREKYPEVVCIMVTAHGTEKTAVEAMKLGAYDYFKKPFDNDELEMVFRRARERLQLLEDKKAIQSRLADRVEFIAESPKMKEILQMIGQVASTDVTVLIQGESGTGKELIASAVHNRSKRAAGPFVKLNCAALPETLIESELFGYEQGAFTGATQRKKGRFELAHGGTIFLDEIGDMTPSTQTKVLRVLQEREFERLGGGRVINVDVRVIAATHQKLEARIQDGSFREDLYYRLNVLNVKLPPLRERLDDIEPLARHFLASHAERFGKPVPELPPGLLERMRSYSWPGNIRELENGIARAVVLENLELVIPGAGGGSPSAAAPATAAEPVPQELFDLPYKEAKRRLLDGFETRYFERMLDRSAGNTTKAARLAGMHRKNFWQKLRKQDEPPPEDDL